LEAFVSGDDWSSLSTDELLKIMPIADKEHDTWTVQTIMRVLAERDSGVKQALARWSEDPTDSRLVWNVIQGALDGSSHKHWWQRRGRRKEVRQDGRPKVRGNALVSEPLANGETCTITKDEIIISDGRKLAMSEVGAVHYDPDLWLAIDAYPHWLRFQCRSKESREQLALLIALASSSPLHDDDVKALKKKYLR
jgi:hypothetical protein